MHNPFTEEVGESPADEIMVAQSQNGDRAALEALILRHQAWIFNIAVRMVFHPQEAEEVTQEVLLKVITRLGTFQGQSQFRTLLYRIVVNHVLNMRRRGGESEALTFSQYGAAINDTPDLDFPDPNTTPVDMPLLVEEAKLSCTAGMLLCLDRKQRLIFTLGEILGVSDAVGGDVLEITPENFRQCLSRARNDLYRFMNDQCGLVNQNNPCRCPKKTKGFIAAGHVDPQRLLFALPHVQRVREAAAGAVRELEDAVESRYAAIFREHPFLTPADHVASIRRLLELREVRSALKLN